MAVIYVDVPSLIENATMKKGVLDGVHKTYRITPVSGYVIHDKNRDMPEYDPVNMMPTGGTVLGYTRGTASCAANYDFAENPREFYAVLESEVTAPENQI
jgi:hypothetical protein